MFCKKKKEKKIKGKYRMGVAPMGLAFLAVLFFTNCNWIIGSFGRITIDTIIYQLTLPLEGTNSDVVVSYITEVLPLPLIVTAGVYLFVTFVAYGRFKALHYKILYGILFGALAVSLLYNNNQFSIASSFINAITPTNIYQEYYVDPDDVEITFPEDEKNLIVIYVESMEITHADEENGGVMETNLIPNLTELANDNISFSDKSSGLGGYYSLSGTGFTFGALLASGSGLPYALPSSIMCPNSSTATYMPDVTTLGDILEEEGYNQVFMCGSDARFSGRNIFYSTHGDYEICDYYQAIEDGIIDEDYYEFWGFEDKYLYEYAKQKLTELAAEDEPFNFSMLTADTHHPDGYVCDLCEDEYDSQYANVVACTDSQLGDFVSWLQEQDFYEDTVVVIVGDHISMASEYFDEAGIEDDVRRVYNCFLNCEDAVTDETEFNNRTFTSLDLFPTILSAMNVEIEGDRLGLGTDLFSGEETLAEKLGIDELGDELTSLSWYYYKIFVK